MSDEHTQWGQGLLVDDAQPQTKQPRLCQVGLLRDDDTPMEFLVDALEGIFGLDLTTATCL